jgi:hypothetical protein
MQATTQLERVSEDKQEQLTFRRDASGWVLAVLNTLVAVNSTYFFLGRLRVGVDGWLMMNTCAPSIFLFVAGFVLGSPATMVAASVLMLRYGTGGLFAFGWDGYNLIPQVGHLLMTLAVLYVGAIVVRRRQWRALALGLIAGAAILVPLMLSQSAWFAAHPGMLEMLFSGAYPVE